MRVRVSCTIVAALLLCPAFGASETQPYSVEEGRHKKALYKIVLPPKWNGKLLITAHGGRPEKATLSADFAVEGTARESLVASEWMVAESSYRRNGILVNDAIEDLKDLLDLIEDRHGKPSRIYLSGASMGGKIGVQMAEEEQCRLHGVLAVGAALWCEDQTNPTALRYRPRIPVLFYSNRDEIEGPRAYVNRGGESDVPPVLWRSGRKGHCNLNRAEISMALEALVGWSEQGIVPESKQVDVEIARKDSTARLADGKLAARVMRVHPVYGNFNLDCTRTDLEQIGIAQGTHFNLRFDDRTFTMYLGHGYGDVPRGQWISFVTADDYVKIARNGARAGELLHCTEGDEVLVEKIEAQ